MSACVAPEGEAALDPSPSPSLDADTDTDDLLSNDDRSSRKGFSLRAFSEMKDTSNSSIVPQDLYKNPTSVVELNKGAPQTSDDSVIKRLTMGKMARTVFDSNQNSTSTTARRPNDKYYMCPSNTFIASNGDVYEIEPFMLPPPTEIAALFKELKDRRDRSDSVVSTEPETTPNSNRMNPTASYRDKYNSERLLGLSKAALSGASGVAALPRVTSFDSVCTETSVKAEAKNVTPSDSSKMFKPKQVRISVDEADVINVVPDDGSTYSESVDSSPRANVVRRPSYREREIRESRENRENRGSRESRSKKPEKPESSIGAYPSFLHMDQPGQKNRDEEIFDWEKFSLRKYLLTEMLGIGEAGHLQPTAVGHMQNFLTVPSKVESFIGFGFFICLDAFLNVITFLPIRVVYSIVLLLCDAAGVATKMLIPIAPSSAPKSRGLKAKGHFHKSHLYDLMRGAFMLLSCYVLLKLNMSRVYHYIRGQTLIKLYVLTAMLEIFDKLLCSFGQDAFDSLYCITRMRPDPRRILFAFVITAIYAILHSSLYFMLIATLTVAINSADQALVTVLVLNNFGEIKSFVFKKFDNQNLFQLSCSDVTERFQLVLFLVCISGTALVHVSVLFLVCISGVALAQAGASWFEILPSHIGVIALMVSSEAVADWIKHAFISKFNHINANVYDDFARVLRKDILNCHKDKVILDQTYAITKRVGLAQIPLGCVFVRYLILGLSSPVFQSYFSLMPRYRLAALFLCWFFALVGVKVTIGLGLVRYAAVIHNEELRLKALEERGNSNGSHRFETQMSMNQLSNIERFTVYKGRVVG